MYTIAFSAFLLIKVDSYTCWIKGNIMMMYFCCIIYDGWPGRAMVPEVICLLIHYIRQIAGSLWRVFASEFYNSFLSCYVTFMLRCGNLCFRVCGCVCACVFECVCVCTHAYLLLISCFMYYQMAVLQQGLPLCTCEMN